MSMSKKFEPDFIRRQITEKRALVREYENSLAEIQAKIFLESEYIELLNSMLTGSEISKSSDKDETLKKAIINTLNNATKDGLMCHQIAESIKESNLVTTLSRGKTDATLKILLGEGKIFELNPYAKRSKRYALRPSH